MPFKPVSDLDTVSKWVRVWELPEPTTMQNGSVTALSCLTEFVH